MIPDPIDNKELRERISKTMGWWMPPTSTDNSRGFDAYPEKTDKVIALLHQVDRAAEDRMGEAIIARHRQANGQWEKTESFIRSYQDQKRNDPHSIFSRLASLQTGGKE